MQMQQTTKPSSFHRLVSDNLQDIVNDKTGIGKYENADIATLGICQIPVTLDPVFAANFLTVIDPRIYSKQGEAWVNFNIGNDISKNCSPQRRTLKVLDAKDYTWPDDVIERIYLSKFALYLGLQKIDIDIWLTQRNIRSTFMILGCKKIEAKFEIDITQAFTLG